MQKLEELEKSLKEKKIQIEAEKKVVEERQNKQYTEIK